MQLPSSDPLAHSVWRPPELAELRQRYYRVLLPRDRALVAKPATYEAVANSR